MTDPELERMDRIIAEAEAGCTPSIKRNRPSIFLQLLCFWSLLVTSVHFPGRGLLVPIWIRYYSRDERTFLLHLLNFARQTFSVRMKLFILEVFRAFPLADQICLASHLPLEILENSDKPTNDAHAFHYMTTCTCIFGPRILTSRSA